MEKNKINVIMNALNEKIVEKRMGEAVAQLISDRINEFPVENRKEVYEAVLEAAKENSKKRRKVICNLEKNLK